MTRDKDYPRDARWSSFREFEAWKREDMKSLRCAIERFRQGCAFVPGYDAHFGALGEIRRWEDDMRIAWRHSQVRRTPRGKNG
jgi:hypothetical protein